MGPESPWTWPGMEEQEEGVDTEKEEIKTHGNMMFSSMIKDHKFVL
jgi:hypothetical protein